MRIVDDQSLKELLGLEPVAVVGCSETPGKAAHDVPAYLHARGYEIIPVNPNAGEIFGTRAYPSLTAVDRPIRLVNVFRPSEEVPGIVAEAIDRGDVRAIWTQLGIRNDEAARTAEEAGLLVVQDRCMKIEHQRLIGSA